MVMPRKFFRSKLRRLWARLFAPMAQHELYEELLYYTRRNLSLDQLLETVPNRISFALNLSGFHVFLREGSEYVLQHPATPRITFPASSSTVSRMKRERKPAIYVPQGSDRAPIDGWQHLATPNEINTLDLLNAQLLLSLEGSTGLMGFVILSRSPYKPFDSKELRFLLALGPQIGRGFETAQFVLSISRQEVQRAHLARELELAREVQERLLPDEIPIVAGIDAAAAYQSAERIGGDYYDLFLAPKGALCIVIADVSGKGLSAALLMASLRASLHSTMLQPDMDAVTAVQRLNTLLYQSSSASRYATLFFAIYDPHESTLTYVNAGHNPPILQRADRSLVRLECGGSVVGLLSGLTYEHEIIDWRRGDRLIAWTDGVTEACNIRGEEWGEAGLESCLLKQRDLTAQASVRDVLTALKSFTAGAAQNDDITLLVLNRLTD
ncbi:PP2C family protein-serine/threonine phosphatase [Granulicella tundricola]|uniref:Protein serine/threonine phosphatase n=1 Tax=Granulicella tundricola (strain ATCC BAA-1859 / DSM 23138 / MP5ACTX9) TaxID=1198114 RepID=E8X5I9_GRATM|nr:PP2C family protein-serine/threonine phosphatase [Granulicella tundricola]ADW70616.1 protein serine/threonine phosphatase [Granulicella tundricola MP5ACTX9]